MQLLIKDVKSEEDIKLFKGLARRLGLKTIKLSESEKEDIGLSLAIEKGKKSRLVSEESVMEILHKIQGK